MNHYDYEEAKYQEHQDNLEIFWNNSRAEDERDYDELTEREQKDVERAYFKHLEESERYHNPHSYYGISKGDFV
jgi:hypothetical protein